MRTIHRYIAVPIAVLVLGACSPRPSESGKTPSSANIIDVLTLFAESVQGDRFEHAMKFLSVSERARFQEAGGPTSPYIQRQLKALRLSTLAKRPTVQLDKNGLLEGIYDQLPELPYTSETPKDSTNTAVPTAETPADTAAKEVVPLPD